MDRRLFNLASAVSLTLCFAVVVLWIRGRRVQDVVVAKVTETRRDGWSSRGWHFVAAMGGASLGYVAEDSPDLAMRREYEFRDGFDWTHDSIEAAVYPFSHRGPANRWWERWGFEFLR